MARRLSDARVIGPLALVLAACGGPSSATSDGDAARDVEVVDVGEDGAPDGTGLPDGLGDADPGDVPSWEDDDALAAWLYAVAAGCPPMSLSTAPGEWGTSLLTDSGCTVRHPSGWPTTLEPGRFEVTTDASRRVGYSIVATYVAGVDWDEGSLGDLLVDELRQDLPDLEVIAAATQEDPYGLGVRLRVLVMKLTLDDLPTLAVAKVVHQGCSIILGSCPLTAGLAWAPAAELPDWACTLAQIEATLHCPSGGGLECDAEACDASCAEGGTCVGDTCMCH